MIWLFKGAFSVLLALPIMIWLEPPWYANFTLGALISMLVHLNMESLR